MSRSDLEKEADVLERHIAEMLARSTGTEEIKDHIEKSASQGRLTSLWKYLCNASGASQNVATKRAADSQVSDATSQADSPLQSVEEEAKIVPAKTAEKSDDALLGRILETVYRRTEDGFVVGDNPNKKAVSASVAINEILHKNRGLSISCSRHADSEVGGSETRFTQEATVRIPCNGYEGDFSASGKTKKQCSANLFETILIHFMETDQGDLIR